jgi:hypothetical protein
MYVNTKYQIPKEAIFTKVGMKPVFSKAMEEELVEYVLTIEEKYPFQSFSCTGLLSDLHYHTRPQSGVQPALQTFAPSKQYKTNVYGLSRTLLVTLPSPSSIVP